MIALTNTPAPAPEKAAQAPPAAASTNPALAHHPILGATALALAPQLINMLAQARATPVVLAPPAAASIPNVVVNPATHGKMAPVRNSILDVQ